MNELTFWSFLTGVAIATSVVSGVVGMTGGMLLLTAMLLGLEPVTAIPIHGLVQLVSNGSRAWFQRKNVRWGAVWRFAVPLLPAGMLGIMLVHAVPSGALLVLVGLFVLGSTFAPRIFTPLTRPRWGRGPNSQDRGRGPNSQDRGRDPNSQDRGRDPNSKEQDRGPNSKDPGSNPEGRGGENGLFFGGALVGFVSPLVGATGTLLGPFVLALELGPQETIGTLAACQIFQHASKVLLFGATGFDFRRYALPVLALSAAAILGSAIGTRLLDRVDARTFKRTVRVVLAALSVKVIVDGILALV